MCGRAGDLRPRRCPDLGSGSGDPVAGKPVAKATTAEEASACLDIGGCATEAAAGKPAARVSTCCPAISAFGKPMAGAATTDEVLGNPNAETLALVLLRRRLRLRQLSSLCSPSTTGSRQLSSLCSPSTAGSRQLCSLCSPSAAGSPPMLAIPVRCHAPKMAGTLHKNNNNNDKRNRDLSAVC